MEKMKVIKKIKKIIMLFTAIIVAIGILTVGKIYWLEKRSEIKKDGVRTEIENVYLVKKNEDNYSVVFIGKILDKEYKNLESVGEIKKGEPIIIKKDGKFGLLSNDGKELLKPEYSGIGVFYNKRALVEKKEKIGVVDNKGNTIIPCEYDDIYIGDNNFYLLKENDKFYSYDLKNKNFIDIESLNKINKELFIVGKNNKLGIMDYKGDLLVPIEYDEISSKIGKLFIGKKLGKYAVYSLENEKYSSDYDYIQQIAEDTYIAKNSDDTKYAFLSDKVVTSPKYVEIIKVDENKFLGKTEEGKVEDIDLKIGSVRENNERYD